MKTITIEPYIKKLIMCWNGKSLSIVRQVALGQDDFVLLDSEEIEWIKNNCNTGRVTKVPKNKRSLKCQITK